MIIIAFFVIILGIPLWLYYRQKPEKRQEQDERVPVFMNYMIGILLIVGLLQFLFDKNIKVSRNLAIFSAIILFTLPGFYRSYTRRFNQNLRAAKIYFILITIGLLMSIVVYFVK